MITWRDHFRAFVRNCRRDPAAAWVEFVLLAMVAALVMLLCSCARERGQAAADNRARVQAAQINLAEVAQEINTARGILKQQFAEGLSPGLAALDKAFSAASRAQLLSQNAEASMAAVADVPTADFPAPLHSATELAVHPEIDAPAPEPSGKLASILALGSTVGLSLLWIVGRVAPSFPVLGPTVGGIAELAWSALSHRDQKASDAVMTNTAAAAQAIAPILDAIQQLPREALPPALFKVVTDDRLQAARTIVGIVAASG